VLIEPDYRGHRIEVYADGLQGEWDAVVRIRRTLTDTPPHVERVTCRKPTAEDAERWAMIWARRWIDQRRKPPA